MVALIGNAVLYLYNSGMELDLPDNIVLFDTEYTTWEGAQERAWNGPNEHREIVQIGAVRMDTHALTEIDAFDIVIKPRINPNLSDFFVTLTGITQKLVNTAGIDFATALKNFEMWRNGDQAYSYGHDAEVIEENCRLCGVPFNSHEYFHDVRAVFEAHGIDTNQYHSSTIVTAFGKQPREGAHNALNDARSIFDGLVLLVQSKRAT